MTYLPPRTIEATTFPEALGADILTSIQMIEEKWNLSFPIVEYLTIHKATTGVASPEQLSGEAGATKMDRLWGESVPDTGSPTWRQPHDVPGIASESNKYNDAVPIRMRVQRITHDLQLKKYGFDKVRELACTVPTSMLDNVALTVQEGDRFVWNNELFEVAQWRAAGYYVNTNVPLYIMMSAFHARRGS